MTANDNRRAAGPGEGYYPEMGERADGTALFVSQIGHGGYYLKWSPERHAEAMEAFKRLRIRPRYMSEGETIKGGRMWSCGVTWEAGRKVQAAKLSVIEMLLD